MSICDSCAAGALVAGEWQGGKADRWVAVVVMSCKNGDYVTKRGVDLSSYLGTYVRTLCMQVMRRNLLR